MKDYLNYALILFAVVVIAIGQIMFKTAARMISVPAGASWVGMITANFNAIVLLALTCALYFVSTLAWVWALRTVPLSIAFMFNSLAFLIVPVAGFLVFGEAVPRHFILGTTLVMAGLIAINMS